MDTRENLERKWCNRDPGRTLKIAAESYRGRVRMG
jgi:hypothetical protein